MTPEEAKQMIDEIEDIKTYAKNKGYELAQLMVVADVNDEIKSYQGMVLLKDNKIIAI